MIRSILMLMHDCKKVGSFVHVRTLETCRDNSLSPLHVNGFTLKNNQLWMKLIRLIGVTY